MAAINAAQLAALMKVKIDAVDSQSGSIENDEILLAMSEALVVAFSDNTFFAAPIVGGGVGTSNVASIEPIPTLAWNLAPSGTYSSTSVDTEAITQFDIKTNGSWTISGSGTINIPSDQGVWRPTNDTNTVSYEVRFTTSGDVPTAIGGANLSGVWTDLTQTMGLLLADSDVGSKTTSVTVEVREKVTPSNTTTAASFTIIANGSTPI